MKCGSHKIYKLLIPTFVCVRMMDKRVLRWTVTPHTNEFYDGLTTLAQEQVFRDVVFPLPTAYDWSSISSHDLFAIALVIMISWAVGREMTLRVNLWRCLSWMKSTMSKCDHQQTSQSLATDKAVAEPVFVTSFGVALALDLILYYLPAYLADRCGGPWEKYSPLKLVGFIIVIFATLMYD